MTLPYYKIDEGQPYAIRIRRVTSTDTTSVWACPRITFETQKPYLNKNQYTYIESRNLVYKNDEVKYVIPFCYMEPGPIATGFSTNTYMYNQWTINTDRDLLSIATGSLAISGGDYNSTTNVMTNAFDDTANYWNSVQPSAANLPRIWIGQKNVVYKIDKIKIKNYTTIAYVPNIIVIEIQRDNDPLGTWETLQEYTVPDRAVNMFNTYVLPDYTFNRAYCLRVRATSLTGTGTGNTWAIPEMWYVPKYETLLNLNSRGIPRFMGAKEHHTGWISASANMSSDLRHPLGTTNFTYEIWANDSRTFDGSVRVYREEQQTSGADLRSIDFLRARLTTGSSKIYNWSRNNLPSTTSGFYYIKMKRGY